MTDTTPNDPIVSPAGTSDSAVFGARHVTRLLIAIVAVFSCVVFAYASNLVGWPAERGVDGSLTQPLAIGAFAVGLVTLAVCAGLGTLLLSRRFFLAGLMTATTGLAVWAVRGGTMVYVLFNAQNNVQNNALNGRVFFQLLGELVVLFGVIGAIWAFLWDRRPAFLLKAEKTKDAGRSTVAAIVAQAALMAVFVLIFVATPQKKQVMTGVFLAGLFSTAIAETYFADRAAARWYWVGPLAAGALGFIAGFSSPGGMDTGDLSGIFAPLARALPLDYASLGCAGALMGYWWMMPEDDGTSDEESDPGSRDAAAATLPKPDPA